MNKSLIILAFTMSLAATTSTAALARSVLDDSVSAAGIRRPSRWKWPAVVPMTRPVTTVAAAAARGGADDGANHTSIIELNPLMEMARRGADDPAGDDRGGTRGGKQGRQGPWRCRRWRQPAAERSGRALAPRADAWP